MSEDEFEAIAPLPTSFWSQPTEALGNESLNLIYAEVCARLRSELIDSDLAGVMEMMLAERAAFLYCHIRNKEQNAGFANDRAYKETLQLWREIIKDLRTAKYQNEERTDLLALAIATLTDAVNHALEDSDIDPVLANQVKEKLAAQLGGGE